LQFLFDSTAVPALFYKTLFVEIESRFGIADIPPRTARKYSRFGYFNFLFAEKQLTSVY